MSLGHLSRVKSKIFDVALNPFLRKQQGRAVVVGLFFLGSVERSGCHSEGWIESNLAWSVPKYEVRELLHKRRALSRSWLPTVEDNASAHGFGMNEGHAINATGARAAQRIWVVIDQVMKVEQLRLDVINNQLRIKDLNLVKSDAPPQRSGFSLDPPFIVVVASLVGQSRSVRSLAHSLVRALNETNQDVGVIGMKIFIGAKVKFDRFHCLSVIGMNWTLLRSRRSIERHPRPLGEGQQVVTLRQMFSRLYARDRRSRHSKRGGCSPDTELRCLTFRSNPGC